MKYTPIPPREVLVEHLDYAPETGDLRWRKVGSNRTSVGAIAGTINAHGHRQVRVAGTTMYVHRAVWRMMTGEDPRNEIDHINGVRDDNRWCNLREATHAQNGQNAKRPAHNTSGIKGVSWFPQSKKWRASITVAQVRKHLGLFEDIADAEAAYLEAARDAFGEFARPA